MKQGIEICEISKAYGDTQALQDCSVVVGPSEFLTLVGPSGCGKTTLLRIIAGFLKAEKGRILFDGNPVDDLPVRERHIAFIMESWGLYPHMNVFANIAYPLRIRRIEKARINELVVSVARVLSIELLLDRRPQTLSSGQRQRVAIARAFIRDDAKALLADEPFSNLDAQLRTQMRAEFKELQRRRGLPCIFVTHDQEEALAIGDRIAVMNQGRIVQVGTARELYHEPNSIFVAGFIGHPAMNLLPVTLERDRVVFGNGNKLGRLVFQASEVRVTQAVLGVRPESLTLSDEGTNDLSGEVSLIEHIEPYVLVHIRTEGHRLIVKAPSRDDLTIGQPLGVRIDYRSARLFDAQTGGTLTGSSISGDENSLVA
jgi:ABC-type sugar transport system ATPase subunit